MLVANTVPAIGVDIEAGGFRSVNHPEYIQPGLLA